MPKSLHLPLLGSFLVVQHNFVPLFHPFRFGLLLHLEEFASRSPCLPLVTGWRLRVVGFSGVLHLFAVDFLWYGLDAFVAFEVGGRIVLVVPSVHLREVVDHGVVVVVGEVGVLFIEIEVGSAYFFFAAFVGVGAGVAEFALAWVREWYLWSRICRRWFCSCRGVVAGGWRCCGRIWRCDSRIGNKKGREGDGRGLPVRWSGVLRVRGRSSSRGLSRRGVLSGLGGTECPVVAEGGFVLEVGDEVHGLIFAGTQIYFRLY